MTLFTLVTQVQDYSLWCAQVLSGMKAEESIRDVATCDLQLFQHQQLWAEIVAREETYAHAVAMGQHLQEQDSSNAREVSIQEGHFLIYLSISTIISDVRISLQKVLFSEKHMKMQILVIK